MFEIVDDSIEIVHFLAIPSLVDFLDTLAFGFMVIFYLLSRGSFRIWCSGLLISWTHLPSASWWSFTFWSLRSVDKSGHTCLRLHGDLVAFSRNGPFMHWALKPFFNSCIKARAFLAPHSLGSLYCHMCSHFLLKPWLCIAYFLYLKCDTCVCVR